MKMPDRSDLPKSRPTSAPSHIFRRNWVDYSPAFKSAMWTGLKSQAILGVLTALVLDSGQTHRAFWVAMLCQWATVFIIILRRSLTPTRLDLTIVRYGIIPLLVVVAKLGPLLLMLLGLSNG
jgi:hypothetical protein